MRVVVFVVVMLSMATTAEASKSCMSKTEARKHFGSVHLYWHGEDHCWDATSIRLHHQLVRQAARKLDQPNVKEAKLQDTELQNSEPQVSRPQDSERQDTGRQDFKPQDSRPQVSRARASSWQASMSKMTADDELVQEPVQAPVQALPQTPAQKSWRDRWVEIKPTSPPLATRWVDIAPVSPPLSKSAPDPELHIMVLALVLIVIGLMLAMAEVLFRAARGAYIPLRQHKA
jgi:hypothetical protein